MTSYCVGSSAPHVSQHPSPHLPYHEEIALRRSQRTRKPSLKLGAPFSDANAFTSQNPTWNASQKPPSATPVMDPHIIIPAPLCPSPTYSNPADGSAYQTFLIPSRPYHQTTDESFEMSLMTTDLTATRAEPKDPSPLAYLIQELQARSLPPKPRECPSPSPTLPPPPPPPPTPPEVFTFPPVLPPTGRKKLATERGQSTLKSFNYPRTPRTILKAINLPDKGQVIAPPNFIQAPPPLVLRTRKKRPKGPSSSHACPSPSETIESPVSTTPSMPPVVIAKDPRDLNWLDDQYPWNEIHRENKNLMEQHDHEKHKHLERFVQWLEDDEGGEEETKSNPIVDIEEDHPSIDWGAYETSFDPLQRTSRVIRPMDPYHHQVNRKNYNQIIASLMNRT